MKVILLSSVLIFTFVVMMGSSIDDVYASIGEGTLPPSGGEGNGGSCSQECVDPTIGVDGQDILKVKDGLSINGKTFTIQSKNEMQVDSLVKGYNEIVLKIYENTGAMQHIEIGIADEKTIQGGIIEYDYLDRISWDANEGIQYPVNPLFSKADVYVTGPDSDNFITATFSFELAEKLDSGFLHVRMFDVGLNISDDNFKLGNTELKFQSNEDILNEAIAAYNDEKPVKAIELFEKAKHNDKTNVIPYLNIAKSYYYLEDYNSALESVESALVYNKTFPESLALKGLILAEMNNPAEAKRVIANIIVPENAQIPVTAVLGESLALLKEGNVNEALGKVNSISHEINSHTPIIRGEIKAAAGDSIGAVLDSEKANTFYPKDQRTADLKAANMDMAALLFITIVPVMCLVTYYAWKRIPMSRQSPPVAK